MAARLPDSLSMSAPRGRRPGPPEDMRALSQGLNAALEGAGEMFARKADAEAGEALMEFQTGFQAAAAERAAAYDGSAPGFAEAEAARFSADLAAFEQANVRRSARGAFRQRADQAKAGYVSHVIGIEGQARARVVAERQEALDRQALGGTQQAYNAAASARLKPLYENLDPADEGFVGKVGETQAGIVGELRESMPERLRPAFDKWAAAAGVEEQAKALRFREERQEQGLRLGASAIVKEAGNQVLGDPDLYEANRALALGSVVALPNDEEEVLRPKIENDLAVARIKGLVAAGREDEAVSLLESGKLDKLVEDKDGLLRYARNGGKSDMERFLQAQDVKSRMEAELDDIETGGTGGQVSLDEISKALGPGVAADHQAQLRLSRAQGQATKALPEEDRADLQARVNAPPPDEDEPDYAVKKRAWLATRKAAEEELKARDADPAGWAWTAGPEGGAAETIRAKAKAIDAATDSKARAEAAASYTRWMAFRQEAVGIDPRAWRLLPKSEAEARANWVETAPPEQRSDRLKQLAQYVGAFPLEARDNSGRTFSPRAMVIRDLTQAGMPPRARAVLADFGDQLGPGGVVHQYAGALNLGPKAIKLEDKNDEKNLLASVQSEMAPVLKALEPLPGGMELSEDRIGLVRMLARRYVVMEGLSTADAAKRAALAYKGGYVFKEGLRLPKSMEYDGTLFPALAAAKRELAANDGMLLSKRGQKGSNSGKQGVFSADAMRFARWTTRADDKGVVLMQPTTDGVWTPVLDKWDRPVTMDWSRTKEWWGTEPKNSFQFIKPPAPPPKSDKLAAPVAARSDVFDALVGAVTWRETRNNPAQISPAGAIGKMQLMPDTARAAAGRLGIKFEPGRLLNDHAYNERLGREELRHLLGKYGHPALALAAYNAGPGNVDKWLRTIGDPRGGGITVDQWVKRVPFKETRGYLLETLPGAYRRLTGG